MQPPRNSMTMPLVRVNTHPMLIPARLKFLVSGSPYFPQEFLRTASKFIIWAPKKLTKACLISIWIGCESITRLTYLQLWSACWTSTPTKDANRVKFTMSFTHMSSEFWSWRNSQPHFPNPKGQGTSSRAKPPAKWGHRQTTNPCRKCSRFPSPYLPT